MKTFKSFTIKLITLFLFTSLCFLSTSWIKGYSFGFSTSSSFSPSDFSEEMPTVDENTNITTNSRFSTTNNYDSPSSEENSRTTDSHFKTSDNYSAPKNSNETSSEPSDSDSPKLNYNNRYPSTDSNNNSSIPFTTHSSSVDGLNIFTIISIIAVILIILLLAYIFFL